MTKNSSKYIDRIGIEREYWLVVDADNRIIEPALFGFPIDEFGFLIEIRTDPHTTWETLIKDFGKRFADLETQAHKLGMHLESLHRRKMDQDFLKRLSNKYCYNMLLDTTANIYEGTSKSHATGLDSGYGTAGLHIHFSRYTRHGKRVQLPIVKMVKAMDRHFAKIIQLSGRNSGEFEIKAHGFEYRSLPSDITLVLAVKYAFEVLKECEPKE